MNKALSRSALILAGVLTAGAAIAASHSNDLPPAVKARKAHMQLYAHNMGILGGMARGNADYDADAASAAASNIAALSNLNQSTYWAPGTDSETVDGSRALPALWENIPDAVAKGEALAAAAATLASTAGDGLEAMQAGVGGVGKACGACHEAYQKPRE